MDLDEDELKATRKLNGLDKEEIEEFSEENMIDKNINHIPVID